MDRRLGGWRQEVLAVGLTGPRPISKYGSALGPGRGPVGSPALLESSPTYRVFEFLYPLGN